MNIILGKKVPVGQSKTNYLNYNRIGFWATVTEVNSETNTVNILTSNKEVIRNVPLASKEWISDDSFERNLPPVGSFVFVLVPNENIANAFVLCSGYPKGESALQILYAKDDTDKPEKDTKREVVTPGHWNETEDYISGTRTITSPDQKISLEISSTNKESQKIKLTCWNNQIELNSNTMSISCWNNTLTITPDEITLEANKDISISAENVDLDVEKDITIKAKKFDINNGALEVSNTIGV